jgi:hypothetical protein
MACGGCRHAHPSLRVRCAGFGKSAVLRHEASLRGMAQLARATVRAMSKSSRSASRGRGPAPDALLAIAAAITKAGYTAQLEETPEEHASLWFRATHELASKWTTAGGDVVALIQLEPRGDGFALNLTAASDESYPADALAEVEGALEAANDGRDEGGSTLLLHTMLTEDGTVIWRFRMPYVDAASAYAAFDAFTTEVLRDVDRIAVALRGGWVRSSMGHSLNGEVFVGDAEYEHTKQRGTVRLGIASQRAFDALPPAVLEVAQLEGDGVTVFD